MAKDSPTMLDDFDERCSVLLQERVQKEMNSKLEELDIVCEPSVPFVKALLSSPNSEVPSNDAILTLWRPSSEQLVLLREGSVLRMRNLDPKSARFEGMRQFVGNSCTRMWAVSNGSSNSLQRRNSTTLFSVTLASKACWLGAFPGTSNGIVTVVGVVLDIKYCDNDHGWTLYLTDKSHLVLRIQCDDNCEKFSSFQDDDFPVVEFHGLRVMPFDNDEGYAVLQYCTTSRFFFKPDSRRARSLMEWSTSRNGFRSLEYLRLYSSMGLQQAVNSDAQTVKAVGFIAGMHVLLSYPQIAMHIDCGMSIMQRWKLPLAVISSFPASCIDSDLNDTVVLNEKEEWKLTQLTKLGHVYRARKGLFCFSLRRGQCASLIGNCGVEFDIVRISCADTKALASMFSAVSC